MALIQTLGDETNGKPRLGLQENAWEIINDAPSSTLKLARIVTNNRLSAPPNVYSAESEDLRATFSTSFKLNGVTLNVTDADALTLFFFLVYTVTRV